MNVLMKPAAKQSLSSLPGVSRYNVLQKQSARQEVSTGLMAGARSAIYPDNKNGFCNRWGWGEVGGGDVIVLFLHENLYLPLQLLQQTCLCQQFSPSTCSSCLCSGLFRFIAQTRQTIYVCPVVTVLCFIL